MEIVVNRLAGVRGKNGVCNVQPPLIVLLPIEKYEQSMAHTSWYQNLSVWSASFSELSPNAEVT